MYDKELDTKTLPFLYYHLKGTGMSQSNEEVFICLLAAANAFGYSE